MACVGWIPYTGLISYITSRDFKVCDQGCILPQTLLRIVF